MITLPRWVAALLVLLGGCERFRRGPAATPDAAAPRVAQVVSLPPTEDRWTLSASLMSGTVSERAVVLVHQHGSHRGEWAPLIARLQRPPALTTLALDLRGHGASTRGPLGDRVTWESFGTDPAQWSGVTSDVNAALRYLTLGAVRRVVIVGAGLGATAAIAAGARTTMVDAVVMVSPGLAYQGLDARAPLSTFVAEPSRPRRVLLLGGADDEPAAEAVPALASLAVGRAEAVRFPGERRHGVSLLNADPARWERVETFVREALDARRAAAPAADSGVR